jgi:hypothetical protein
LAVFNVVAVALAVAMSDLFNKINRLMEFISSIEFNMQVIANLGNEMFRELLQCDLFFFSQQIHIHNINALYTFYS